MGKEGINGVVRKAQGKSRDSGRTCSPFSRSTRSHSRTSPATSTKSLARSSNSTLQAFTISSSVLPRSKDGVGAATAAGVDPAAFGAVDAAGLAPPNVSALEGAALAAAALVVEAGVAVGLAPNEKDGAAVPAGAAYRWNVVRGVRKKTTPIAQVRTSSTGCRSSRRRLGPEKGRRSCNDGWRQGCTLEDEEGRATYRQRSTQPGSRQALRQRALEQKLPEQQTRPALRQTKTVRLNRGSIGQ